MPNQGNVPVFFPVTPIRDNWQPKANILVNVTNETLSVMTTSTAHGYLDGLSVRVFVPSAYGMHIPYTQTQIVVLSDTTFRTLIDTSSLQPFVIPVFPLRFTQAQVVPMDGPFRNIAPH